MAVPSPAQQQYGMGPIPTSAANEYAAYVCCSIFLIVAFTLFPFSPSVAASQRRFPAICRFAASALPAASPGRATAPVAANPEQCIHAPAASLMVGRRDATRQHDAANTSLFRLFRVCPKSYAHGLAHASRRDHGGPAGAGNTLRRTTACLSAVSAAAAVIHFYRGSGTTAPGYAAGICTTHLILCRFAATSAVYGAATTAAIYVTAIATATTVRSTAAAIHAASTTADLCYFSAAAAVRCVARAATVRAVSPATAVAVHGLAAGTECSPTIATLGTARRLYRPSSIGFAAIERFASG